MKKLFTLLSLLFFLFLGNLADAATIRDGAGLLTDSDRKAVFQEMQKVEAQYGIRMAIVTTKSIGNRTPKSVADRIADENSKENGSIALLLVMNTRDYYISTKGNLRSAITDGRGISSLENAMLPSLKKGNYSEGFLLFTKETGNLLAKEHSSLPDPIAILVGALLAALCAISFRSYLRSTMTNVSPSGDAMPFLAKNTFHLKEESDTYLYTDRTVTPLPRANHSGSSFGGGSHGGGGGKF